MLVRRARWGSAIDDRTVNDMLNRRLARAKTRPNAYEIPTWAIANAIRRRADKAKAVVRDGPEPPRRSGPMAWAWSPSQRRSHSRARGSEAGHALLVGFALVPPSEPELRLRHRWLDSWRGIGDGMAPQEFLHASVLREFSWA